MEGVGKCVGVWGEVRESVGRCVGGWGVGVWKCVWGVGKCVWGVGAKGVGLGLEKGRWGCGEVLGEMWDNSLTMSVFCNPLEVPLKRLLLTQKL